MANATTRRARKKVDPNETPDVKFARLIETRGHKLEHQMKLLKNLSTSYAYKVNPELTKKWLDKFEKAFGELKTSWETAINKGKVKPEAVEAEATEVAETEATT